MSSSMWTRIAITALAGCMVAVLATPAWGQGDDLTLRRDGSKAVPFVADVSGKGGADSSNAPVMRRDGSKAVPFVADLDPEPAAAGDGFDWSDAAIGAGLGAAAVALAVAGAVAMRRRRPVQGRRRAQQA
ncbi:MAG: hypothetical protein ACRDMA_17505 [Solirubrobacterales bacterium]